MAGRNGWVEDGRRRDRVRGAGVVRGFRMAIQPIEHQRTQMNVLVGGGAETLDQVTAPVATCVRGMPVSLNRNVAITR